MQFRGYVFSEVVIGFYYVRWGLNMKARVPDVYLGVGSVLKLFCKGGGSLSGALLYSSCSGVGFTIFLCRVS